jgi:hypothetical protein
LKNGSKIGPKRSNAERLAAKVIPLSDDLRTESEIEEYKEDTEIVLETWIKGKKKAYISEWMSFIDNWNYKRWIASRAESLATKELPYNYYY